jgi:predicted metalloprotease with PDZ domain
MNYKLAVAPLLLALSSSTLALAQDGPVRSSPVAAPLARNVPDAADTPYPGGTIGLQIDATDIQRGVYRVVETIPVALGTRRLTVLFPQWLPGTHGPRGPLNQLADLRFEANGKPLTWTRDPLEVHAFHVDLPEGAREVVARFVNTSPLQTSEGRITMTQEMLNLQWEKMSLYPAGHYVRQIRYRPTVTFPSGWAVATALDGKRVAGDTVSWAEVDYETLVDSPIFAGKHYRRWDLGSGVALNTFADTPDLLEVTPEHIAPYRALVREALATFGSRHFDHYDFLLAMTDRLGSIGLEHHRSSENQYEPRTLVDWDKGDWDRNVIPHEFVHSWDGKFRRPARLWTPDYRQPMQDDLLWVYEGQTQFWGLILAARSGVQKKETVLGALASSAGAYSELPGRGWRSVEDTTLDPVFAARLPKPSASLHRGEDYYSEGALIWLEADQIIRAGTGGRKGLDDFARAFFGIRDGDWGEVTYEFGDVVAALNGVYRYDWADFLTKRIRTPGQPAPIGGIERGGYRLEWKDEPNPYDKARFTDAKSLSLTHSLGLTIDKDAKVTASQWNSPAFNAGIVAGAKVIAVNGEGYDGDKLKAAITAAKDSRQPIELLIQRGTRFETVPVAYAGGLRWPWLVKRGAGEAGLDRLLAPRRGK